MISRIRRAADTVRRPASFWTPSVHGLLRHLQAAGFPAPRPLGTEGDQHPAGLIDFDHARPAPPIFDIAYALEYAAPFRDDRECLRWLRYPQPPDRRRRIEIFRDAYGTPVPAAVSRRKIIDSTRLRPCRHCYPASPQSGCRRPG
jgi:hypothetical protein